MAAEKARGKRGGLRCRGRGIWPRPAIATWLMTVDASRQVITALGEQAAERFARLEQQVDEGFAEMRGKLEQTAAGQQRIAELLTTLISREGDE